MDSNVLCWDIQCMSKFGYIILLEIPKETTKEKLFKRPSFLEPACDGQHGYRVLPADSNFIDIWIFQHTLNQI